jgi:hypothetical protein
VHNVLYACKKAHSLSVKKEKLYKDSESNAELLKVTVGVVLRPIYSSVNMLVVL